MYAGALDAHGDSQVDGGPARLFLPAVTAPLVPRAPQGHAQCCRPLGWRAWRGIPTTLQRGKLLRLHIERKNSSAKRMGEVGVAIIFRGECIVVVVWTGLRQLSVGSLSVGEVDAALQSTEPGLLQLL